METRQDGMETELRTLAATVGRVETNQNHAEELNKLRFASLETSVNGIAAQLAAFISRMEGIITGEVQTAQTRQGAEIMADYMRWRKEVDADRVNIWSKEKKQEIESRLDAQDIRNGRIDLVARVVWGLLGGNVVVIITFIAWLAVGRPT